MLKFRKMSDNARGLALTLSDDERLTRVGGWLVKHKLDELPQFWHVLRGEMSLVGPRPESDVFVSRFEPDYDRILEVRPGIMGLSQLAFAEESQILDRRDPIEHYVQRILPQKVSLDRLYIERQSLGLDLRILLWSVVAVLLKCQVAVHRDSGRLNLRRR
jgi:lipopolysaccharide/colanic/teichoic acid biosynthesis glycosyltransferase